MDDKQYPAIGFGLVCGGELVYCEAVMQDRHFDVLFNGKWMASIIYNDDWEWELESGTVLPDETIAEIGFRIQSTYDI